MDLYTGGSGSGWGNRVWNYFPGIKGFVFQRVMKTNIPEEGKFFVGYKALGDKGLPKPGPEGMKMSARELRHALDTCAHTGMYLTPKVTCFLPYAGPLVFWTSPTNCHSKH